MKSAVKISPVDMEARKKLGIRSGDTVRVWQNIVELKKGKLAVKHGTEPGAMFTVRKVASGVWVEKIFPLYSPMIESVEVLRRARTRRAKLYFIRRKASREAKHAMRKQIISSQSEAAPEAAPQPAEAAATE